MTEYKLKTIKDIFDKVPIDRLDALFAELKQAMEQCALVRGSSVVDHVVFPESIKWVDDGKGEVEVRVHTIGENYHIGTIKSTVRS